MFGFLKTETYNTVFSIIIGIGLVAVLTPGCRETACSIKKAPPVDEVIKKTYQISDKCYKFKTSNISCPSKGVIESFEVETLRSSSY
jgi:hypothetical protein